VCVCAYLCTCVHMYMLDTTAKPEATHTVLRVCVCAYVTAKKKLCGGGEGDVVLDTTMKFKAPEDTLLCTCANCACLCLCV